MKNKSKVGVLFCCTANICRSPTAEVMFRDKATRAGIIDLLEIDSAATHDYRLGEPPAAQAQLAASRRGYDLSALRARLVNRDDLESFEYILAMDMGNLTVLHKLGDEDLWDKPRLMMSYSKIYKVREVPDPYSGGPEGFELALDMLESATDGLLAEIQAGLSQNDTSR